MAQEYCCSDSPRCLSEDPLLGRPFLGRAYDYATEWYRAQEQAAMRVREGLGLGPCDWVGLEGEGLGGC